MPPFPKNLQSIFIWRSLAGWRFRSPPVTVWSGSSCHFSSGNSATSRERSSKKMLIYLLTVAGAMVGASYAAVPLYRRFCQATGYGGTVQRREAYARIGMAKEAADAASQAKDSELFSRLKLTLAQNAAAASIFEGWRERLSFQGVY